MRASSCYNRAKRPTLASSYQLRLNHHYYRLLPTIITSTLYSGLMSVVVLSIPITPGSVRAEASFSAPSFRSSGAPITMRSVMVSPTASESRRSKGPIPAGERFPIAAVFFKCIPDFYEEFPRFFFEFNHPDKRHRRKSFSNFSTSVLVDLGSIFEVLQKSI